MWRPWPESVATLNHRGEQPAQLLSGFSGLRTPGSIGFLNARANTSELDSTLLSALQTSLGALAYELSFLFGQCRINVKLELIGIGHAGDLELEALHLKQTCNEGHPATQAIQLGNKQSRSFKLAVSDCFLKFGAIIISA